MISLDQQQDQQDQQIIFHSFARHHLIEPGLYLGDILAVRSNKELRKLNIQSVLTVMDSPVREQYKLDNVEYFFIDVDDMPTEDILSHFTYAYKVISKARSGQKNIYVHCQAGVSRSATIVTSYLMRKYKKTAEEALDLVKSKRNVGPNPGFVRQLMMYEKWNCKVNGSNREYRTFLLENLVHKSKMVGLGKQAYLNVLKNSFLKYFGKLESAESKCNLENIRGKVYVCSEDSCKQKLFFEINVIKEIGKNNEKEDKKYICNSVFIEPQRWMLECLNPSGSSRIKCIGCSKEIGILKVAPPFECDCLTHKNAGKCLIVKVDHNRVLTQF